MRIEAEVTITCKVAQRPQIYGLVKILLRGTEESNVEIVKFSGAFMGFDGCITAFMKYAVDWSLAVCSGRISNVGPGEWWALLQERSMPCDSVYSAVLDLDGTKEQSQKCSHFFFKV